MSNLLNVGSRALQANQVALQTTGNNIANVNTPGYSRQSVVLKTVEGQYSGSGYIGNGVSVQTIQRNYSAFLTTQATQAGATQSADVARAEKLNQLEGIFGGGATGLGSAINDMLNSFSDVASAPTDLTARTVALTRVDETASRMRSSAQQLDDLQSNVTLALSDKVGAINKLTKSIADVNEQVARTQGNGQPANDLLDQRDQLIRNLNQYVQTTSVAASDGSVSLFIGGSQPLVMGSTAAQVSLVDDEFGNSNSKLAITRGGLSVTLNENMLGGGEVSGLLRFQNNDMVEASNLLGRMTLAVTTSMNTQHSLGLDLDGNPGGDLFSPITFGASNVMKASSQAVGAGLSLGISDVSQFAASDYEFSFTSASAGNITRRSDGVVSAFNFATTNPAVVDGLAVKWDGNNAQVGDKFLVKPFATSASNITSEFSSPRGLAMASPIAVSAGVNTGTLSVAQLNTRSATALGAITLTFDGAGSYTRSDTGAATYPFVSGTAIESGAATVPATPGWSMTLTGTPKAGDTYTVQAQPSGYRNLNADNATAMMNLRDVAMFDGAALSDGYAGLMAQVGVRVQSANFAADFSSTMASGLESSRAAVSGVNLDEEAAKLLQFQQAYQASAKMIQIAQGIFDTLIQSLGR